IFFPLQSAFEVTSIGHGLEFLCYKIGRVSCREIGCVIAAALMLRDQALQIFGRSNVISVSAAQDVNPSHANLWVGRDSNPEPTPKAFGAAPLIGGLQD